MNWRMIFPWKRKPAAECPAEDAGLPIQRPFSKARALTDDQVREVRRRNAAGETQYALSKEFGISQPSLRACIRRETYRDVE